MTQKLKIDLKLLEKQKDTLVRMLEGQAFARPEFTEEIFALQHFLGELCDAVRDYGKATVSEAGEGSSRRIPARRSYQRDYYAAHKDEFHARYLARRERMSNKGENHEKDQDRGV